MMETIKLDKAIYSKEVLLKTAYSFTDRAYLHLAQDDIYWIVRWEPKKGNNLISAEFENELIQQETRLILEQKTADLRKIIIARALASTIIDRPLPENPSVEVLDEDEAEKILKGWHETHDIV